MSTHESATGTNPTRGSTAGAGAGESIKETVHHIQDFGDTVRENAMDFVDTMFGTPRHPEQSRVGALRTGDDVTRADRAGRGDVPVHPADDATARTSTSAAGHANDVPACPSDRPATEGSTAAEGGTMGKSESGGEVEAAPTQPPPFPPRDAQV